MGYSLIDDIFSMKEGCVSVEYWSWRNWGKDQPVRMNMNGEEHYSDKTTHNQDEIRQTLNPFFAKMGISKPYMLVWYITSKGKQFMKELTSWSRAETETYLWQMVWELNGEFVAHRPIQ